MKANVTELTVFLNETATHVVDSIRLAVEILVCHLLQFFLQILESFVFVIGALNIAADLLEILYFILGLR